MRTGEGVVSPRLGDLYAAALAMSSSDKAECADGADDDDAASSDVRRLDMYGGRLVSVSYAASIDKWMMEARPNLSCR